MELDDTNILDAISTGKLVITNYHIVQNFDMEKHLYIGFIQKIDREGKILTGTDSLLDNLHLLLENIEKEKLTIR